VFWNIIKINILFCVIRKIVFIFAAGNDKSHITMSEINQTINLHVSVDCVLIGFDGEQFRVLLVRQVGKQSEDGYRKPHHQLRRTNQTGGKHGRYLPDDGQ
jgi:hypothetical protein